MFEYFSPVGFFYRVARDVWGFIRGKRRNLSHSEVIALRQRWKDEIESKIFERRQQKLSSDVIVRDVRRADEYPEINERSRGISPYFRAGLVGTYHRGILIGLRWGGLVFESKTEKWRFVDYEANEDEDIKVILIGYISFEKIEAVDWQGDEFYGYPHIFCHFDGRKKQPYEKLVYCKEKNLNDYPFYSEVAETDDVRKFSKKFGLKFFG